MLNKADKLMNVNLRPYDLRRHAIMQADSGTPIEIVSKVILIHANLAEIQIVEKGYESDSYEID